MVGSLVDVGKMIHRLAAIIPGWCSIKKFSTGQFVLLKKEADFTYEQVRKVLDAIE